jgi:hypothetical protein
MAALSCLISRLKRSDEVCGGNDDCLAVAIFSSMLSNVCRSAIVEMRAEAWCTLRVRVEFMDAAGQWHLLENAYATRIRSGEYEITLSDVPYMWPVPIDLFDGASLRVDGRETKEVVGTRRERDVLILQAKTQPSRP